MVLNGREEFVGSEVGALQTALRDDTWRDHLDMSILFSAPSSAGLGVKFSLTGNVRRPLDIIGFLRTMRSVPTCSREKTVGGRFSMS
jgi:hypothetical protein